LENKAVKHITLVAVLGLLVSAAGCSTPADVRNSGSKYEAKSTKTSKAVAGCLADKLELAFKYGVNSRPTSGGYSVWVEHDLGGGLYGKVTGVVVDIDDLQDGSTIRFYSKGLLASAMETVLRLVNECKG
jgi:hypothetical protein